MLKIICLLLVFAGACTMLASIIVYANTIKSYTNFLTSGKRFVFNRHTSILIMMLFFLIGYAATIFYIFGFNVVDMSLLLIATIFFFGAIFCFSVVYVQSEFLNKLEQSANELREALGKSETANTALKGLNQELMATMEALENTQSRLVFSEKMSTLGKLMAGISHEINTPIGVIKASAQSMEASFSEQFSQLFTDIRRLSEEDFQDFIFYTNIAITNSKKYTSTLETRALKQEAQRTLAGVKGFNDGILELLIRNSLLDSDTIRSIAPRLASDTFKQALQSTSKTVSIITSIDSITFSVEKVIKLVSSMKSFSHINVGRDKSSFNIVAGIEMVLAIYANKLKYDVEVVTDFDDVPNIMGYEDELSQVWSNLIENAVYAMQEGNNVPLEQRQPNKLCISVKRADDEHISVSISDNGGGISPDKLKNIFEPFFTTKPTGIGSGLGLSISKQIIDKHNGVIHIESKEGGGTTFTTILPI